MHDMAAANFGLGDAPDWRLSQLFTFCQYVVPKATCKSL